MVPDDSEFYTTEEVALICRVKPITVREWIRTGKLDAERPSKAYLVRKTTLEEFLRSRHG